MGALSGVASIVFTLLFGVVSWFTVEKAARWLRRRILARSASPTEGATHVEPA
jgi:peptidoglycan/LPS O-acetylase OafA/YrhL